MQNQIATYSAKVVDSYPQYNLTAEVLYRNNQRTNIQAIVKNNKVVGRFTEHYKVFPNEEAYKMAQKIAKNNGLIPADKVEFMKAPAFMGHMDGAITALFVDPTPVNISKGTKYDDDLFRFGIAIGSSITGQSALKAYAFTMREICSNFAFHFFHGAGLHLGQVDEGQASKIAGKVFVHSKGLDTSKFEESVEAILKQGKRLVQRYQAMRIEKLLEKQAIELANKLPKTIIKSNKLPWVDWNKKAQSVQVKLGSGVTAYQAYNDITDVLSHKDSDKFTYGRKMEYFRRADEILVNAY